MRKNQVLSTGVQVEALAKLKHGHDGALNVPSRTAGADLALPGSLTGLRRFPEREIAGVVFLVFVNIYSLPVFHTCEIFFRELAIARELCDPKIVRTIFGSVGKALLDETRNELRH